MSAALSREAAAYMRTSARRIRPSLHAMSPDRARSVFEQESARSGDPQPLHQIDDVRIDDGVRGRLYRPAPGVLPVVLFFHGGGWVVGSVDTHDHLCRALALSSGCAVLSVDYRLAPEYPYPAAVEDALSALRWTVGNAEAYELDVSRAAVSGDSAGGNLAIALALRASELLHGPALRLLILFYPVTTTDLCLGVDPDYDGVVLSRDELAWHQAHYLPNLEDRSRADASPLDCADLSGLPEVVLILAECDPIARQGLAFARALREARVPTTTHVHAGAIHGFVQFPQVFESARMGVEQAAHALRGALRVQQSRGGTS